MILIIIINYESLFNHYLLLFELNMISSFIGSIKDSFPTCAGLSKLIKSSLEFLNQLNCIHLLFKINVWPI
jgi:hypothetical protein